LVLHERVVEVVWLERVNERPIRPPEFGMQLDPFHRCQLRHPLHVPAEHEHALAQEVLVQVQNQPPVVALCEQWPQLRAAKETIGHQAPPHSALEWGNPLPGPPHRPASTEESCPLAHALAPLSNRYAVISPLPLTFT